jgi:hypothetical protein
MSASYDRYVQFDSPKSRGRLTRAGPIEAAEALRLGNVGPGRDRFGDGPPRMGFLGFLLGGAGLRRVAVTGIGCRAGHVGLRLVGGTRRNSFGQLAVELSPFLFGPSQFLDGRCQIEKVNRNDVGPGAQVGVADQGI